VPSQVCPARRFCLTPHGPVCWSGLVTSCSPVGSKPPTARLSRPSFPRPQPGSTFAKSRYPPTRLRQQTSIGLKCFRSVAQRRRKGCHAPPAKGRTPASLSAWCSQSVATRTATGSVGWFGAGNKRAAPRPGRSCRNRSSSSRTSGVTGAHHSRPTLSSSALHRSFPFLPSSGRQSAHWSASIDEMRRPVSPASHSSDSERASRSSDSRPTASPRSVRTWSCSSTSGGRPFSTYAFYAAAAPSQLSSAGKRLTCRHTRSGAPSWSWVSPRCSDSTERPADSLPLARPQTRHHYHP
jgi:hypothetical protein